jgi:hypothetical protein
VALYMHPVRVYKEFSCLLLQVSVLSLADFMYPSSGLLPGSIAGMLKVRTRWVVSSSVGAVGHRRLASCREGAAKSPTEICRLPTGFLP